MELFTKLFGDVAASRTTTSTSATKSSAPWSCVWQHSSPSRRPNYLNGHSFIEQELNRTQIGFRKTDNAFLAVDDVAALQAADRLSAEIIRERLDYWTLILGPKFSLKERRRINRSRFYAFSQVEYCRNVPGNITAILFPSALRGRASVFGRCLRDSRPGSATETGGSQARRAASFMPMLISA
jgi:hypothetical protein